MNDTDAGLGGAAAELRELLQLSPSFVAAARASPRAAAAANAATDGFVRAIWLPLARESRARPTGFLLEATPEAPAMYAAVCGAAPGMQMVRRACV